MFRPVSSKLNAPLLEEQTLNFWNLRRIFARSGERNTGGAEFVFYEAPLDASRRPDLSRALVCTFQDAFLRYRLMRGYHVTRRGGWSAPALKAGDQDGVTIEHLQDWERFFDRIAFWSDMQDAYVTFTGDYIESVWWVLKTLWERGLLYQSYRVVPYCPRCGTPLSAYEASLQQREIIEPAAYVRLPLVDEPGVSLLAWTAAPWTLPGSVAVAAHPEAEYVVVERPMQEGGRERLILARACLKHVFGDGYVRVLDSFKGRRLKGRRYRPLFTYLLPEGLAHRVVMQPGLDLDQGSGLAPLAPSFDAKALHAAHEHDLPPLAVMEEGGVFAPQMRPWGGRFVKDAAPYILQDLEARGLLYRAEEVEHEARFCWRCASPVLDFACSAWYLRTVQQKDRLARLSQDTRWQPAQVKNDPFGAMLEDPEDWLIGRHLPRGAPLPIWECESCHHQALVASREELARLSGLDLAILDLQRPAIDQVYFLCSECKGAMRRIPEVLDAWFEAGAMPAAQWHFPFENRDLFRAHFPADLVCDVSRPGMGWFYALHTLSALLFDGLAFENAICLGLLLEPEGQAAAGTRDNASDLSNILNTHGADALRWHIYTATYPSEARRISPDLLEQAGQKFNLVLWDVYAFFIACANRYHWQPSTTVTDDPPGDIPVPLSHPGKGVRGEGLFLDRWLRSELHALVRQMTEAMDDYDLAGAVNAAQTFVEDLSQWFLPLARSRMVRGGADATSHYKVLYETLVTLGKLLAPFTPFLAEGLYQNLVRSIDDSAPESIHLCDWPGFDPTRIHESVHDEMRLVRQWAALGQEARRASSIRESQPLAEALLATGEARQERSLEVGTPLLVDALNVRKVRFLEVADLEALAAQPGWAVARESEGLTALKIELTPELVRAGLAGEFLHRAQELRRQADCEIAEPIHLYVTATPSLVEAIQAHQDVICLETLALGLEYAPPPPAAVTAEAWFDAQWMKLGLVRARPEEPAEG